MSTIHYPCVGFAGGYADDLRLRDVVAAQGACTNSRYAHQFNLPGDFSPHRVSFLTCWSAGQRLRRRAQGVNIRVGNVLSSDTFYEETTDAALAWKKMGVLAVEMGGRLALA